VLVVTRELSTALIPSNTARLPVERLAPVTVWEEVIATTVSATAAAATRVLTVLLDLDSK